MNSIFYFSLISISWLIYSRYAPWLSFQSDVFGSIILYAITVISFFKLKRVLVNNKINLSLFIFTIIIAISYSANLGLTSKIHAGVFLVASLFFIFISGYQDKDYHGEFVKFSSIIVLMAILTGSFGLIQWSGIIDYSTSTLSWLMPAPAAGRIMGNIGQANLFALSISYGLFFTLYLLHARQISLVTGLPVALFFAVIIGLTQSRAILLGLIAASLLVAIKRLELRSALILYLSTAVACVIALFGNAFLAFVNPSAEVRAVTEAAGISLRLQLWREVFTAAWSEPFRADGLGGTIVRYFDVLPALDLGNQVHFTYAHNLYIDLIVWLSPILGTAVFGLLLYFLAVITYRVQGIHVYLWLPMVVIATHSMFEFPYAYFSLAFIPALTAGYLTRVYSQSEPRVISRSVALPIFLATALFGAWIAYDYSKIYGSYLAVQIERRFYTKPTEEELNPRVTLLRDWSEHLQFARGDHETGCQRLEGKTDAQVRRLIMLHPSPFAIQRVLSCATVSEAEKAYWRVRYPEL